MKYPLLLLTTLAFSLSFHAFADDTDAKERAARKAKLDHAWDKVEDFGDGVAKGVSGAIDDFVGGVRDITHERPELQSLPHLVALKKGDEVRIAYCKPLIAQIFRDREKHPGNNRCEEALHKGSFKLKELKACAARHEQDNGAAFNLERQLDRVSSRKEEYNYNFLGMYGKRDTYRSFFQTCAKEIAARKPAGKKKPADEIKPQDPAPEQPKLEFKPVEIHDSQQPTGVQELNGTL